MSKNTTKQPGVEGIIEQIDNAGLFQKRFAVVYGFFLICLIAMQYIHKVMSITVPDHWCHVPERDNTTYTIAEWKNLTIPNYYNQNETIPCDHGWQYDHTWFDATASTQNNWVCDDGMVPINVLAVNRVAEVIGTITFGQLADNFGRMPIFITSLIIMLIARIATVVTSSWVYLFLLCSFISSLPCTAVWHSAYIIAIEISAADKRAFLGALLACGWSIGATMSSLFMWWLRDWIPHCLLVALPCLIYILLKNWMIESPRWLASRGNKKRCIRELKKIANTNKTKLPDNIEAQLDAITNAENASKVRTIFSLFSSLRLAKNVIILIYSIALTSFVYISLILSINNLAGNPYLNYFFLGLVDLPILLICKYLCDRYGRRFSSVCGAFITLLGCLIVIFTIQDESKSLLVTIIYTITKGTALMATASLTLQLLEICPTCVRQTGASSSAISANSLAILAPYVVALGTSINIIIPYITFATCALIALISCLFLPETLGHQLPDTFDDAATFGANQDFWGRTKPKKRAAYDKEDILLESNSS